MFVKDGKKQKYVNQGVKSRLSSGNDCCPSVKYLSSSCVLPKNTNIKVLYCFVRIVGENVDRKERTHFDIALKIQHIGI